MVPQGDPESHREHTHKRNKSSRPTTTSTPPLESETLRLNREYESLFGLALSFQTKGDFQKAIDTYTQAIELIPWIAGAHVNRGTAYESMGALDLALRDLNHALTLEPLSQAYNNRAGIFFKKRDYDHAIQDYDESIKLNPENINAYIYRGHCNEHKLNHEQAIRDYKRALAINPENAEPYVHIGVLHASLGNHEKAIQYFDKALSLDSGSPYTYLNRGYSYSKIGATDSALSDFQESLRLDPAYTYAYSARALILNQKGDSDGAIQDFDKALTFDPNYVMGYIFRSALHLENGNLDSAIQDCDKALALETNNPDVYNDRGVAFWRKGDFARAMQDFDSSLGVRPNKSAFANRCILSLQLGKWDQARSDLLSANNMGMNVVKTFREGYGEVAEFERQFNVKVPHDLARLVSVEEPLPSNAGESILAMFERLRESVPADAFDNMPSDGAKNYKHYLYGWPKE